MDQTVLSIITLQTGYLVHNNRRTQLFITRPVQYLILNTFMYGLADNPLPISEIFQYRHSERPGDSAQLYEA